MEEDVELWLAVSVLDGRVGVVAVVVADEARAVVLPVLVALVVVLV